MYAQPEVCVLAPTSKAEERAGEFLDRNGDKLAELADSIAAAKPSDRRELVLSLAASVFVAGHDGAMGRDPASLRQRYVRKLERDAARKEALRARWEGIRVAYAETSESLLVEERVGLVMAEKGVSRATVFRVLQLASSSATRGVNK